MTKAQKSLFLVPIATSQDCEVCEKPLELGVYAFWQRLEDGTSRAWHRGDCDERQLRELSKA